VSEPAIPAPRPSASVELPSKNEPRFDPTSWRGALITMLAIDAVLWIVEIVNAADNYRLDRYGLRPRDVGGLIGILTMPFLHASFGHLLANSIPFVFIGWAVLLSGVRPLVLSSTIIVVVGGAITWLIAPSVGPHGGIVGASAVVMGWLGYLLGRAYFSRRIIWIIVAVLVVFFFGTLLGGLFPSVGADVSWQAHVAGFAAGVLAAWLMHPRHDQGSRFRRSGGDAAPGAPATPQPLS
jgi:membrane associated rhomboid family serine protease